MFTKISIKSYNKKIFSFFPPPPNLLSPSHASYSLSFLFSPYLFSSCTLALSKPTIQRQAMQALGTGHRNNWFNLRPLKSISSSSTTHSINTITLQLNNTNNFTTQTTVWLTLHLNQQLLNHPSKKLFQIYELWMGIHQRAVQATCPVNMIENCFVLNTLAHVLSNLYLISLLIVLYT